MREREVREYLEENGFTFVRDTGHGSWIWTDGTTRILCSKRHNDPRSALAMKADVKRAIKVRPLESPSLRAKVQPKDEPLKQPLAKFIASGQPDPIADLPEAKPLFPEPKSEPKKEEKPVTSKPTTKEPNRTFDKFSALERHKTWSKIRELWLDGRKTNASIAAAMQAQGWTMPDGVTPITTDYVGGFLYRALSKQENLNPEYWLEEKPAYTPPKIVPRTTFSVVNQGPTPAQAAAARAPEPMPAAPPAPAPEPKPVPAARVNRLPDFVMSILTDPTLTPEQKVKMITAYAEL